MKNIVMAILMAVCIVALAQGGLVYDKNRIDTEQSLISGSEQRHAKAFNIADNNKSSQEYQDVEQVSLIKSDAEVKPVEQVNIILSLRYLLLILIIVFGTTNTWLCWRIGNIDEKQKAQDNQIKILFENVHKDDLTEENTKRISGYCPEITEIHPIRQQLPEIIFVQGVLKNMVEGINMFRKYNPGVETGYGLVGHIVDTGPSRKIIVTGIVKAGPATTCSNGHVEFNREYQQNEIEKMRLIDWNASHIGDAHLHPGTMDYCSNGDYQTDRNNVLSSKSREMVFVIATVHKTQQNGQLGQSMYFNGLKLDFYYMGSASDYEYEHFMPKIVSGEALEVSHSLSNYYNSDPRRVLLDFDNLHRLANYDYQFLKCPLKDGSMSSCVEMKHKKMNYKVLILFGDSLLNKPDVYIEMKSEVMGYEPDYMKQINAEDIWFTNIVIAAERDVKRLLDRQNEVKSESADIQPVSAEQS